MSLALLASVARTQYGAFSRVQAQECGVTRAMVEHRLRTGEWIRRAPAVFAFASHTPTVHQRLMVALLDLGPAAAVSHRCAVALAGVDGFTLGSHGLELLVPYGVTATSRLARVRRTRSLPASHLTTLQGLRCTDLNRALCDLADGTLTPRQLARAVDDGLLRHGLRLDRLDQVAADLQVHGRRGPALIRQLVAVRRHDAFEPTESVLEDRLLEIVRRAGLPLPMVQQRPPWWTSRPQRVDFTWAEATMLLEGDGRRWHSRLQTQAADIRRDRLAARNGFALVRATWEDVTVFPDELADDLVATYRLRRSAAA